MKWKGSKTELLRAFEPDFLLRHVEGGDEKVVELGWRWRSRGRTAKVMSGALTLRIEADPPAVLPIFRGLAARQHQTDGELTIDDE